MKNIIPTLCLGLVLCGASAHATISFDVYADGLQTETPGDLMSTTGSVLLIADTANDSFGQALEMTLFGGFGNIASYANFLNGVDDLVLWRSSPAELFSPGLLFASIEIALGSYGGQDLGVGDQLALVWLPNVGSSESLLAAGTSYGIFSNLTPPAGEGDAWEVPNDGASFYPLYAWGDNAAWPGSTPASDLVASHHVAKASVPDAGPGMLLSALSIAGLIVYRRRRG